MANAFAQLFYYIVYSTKKRGSPLAKARWEELFRYIWDIEKGIDCHLHHLATLSP
jgi:hypothetical protein